MNDVEAQEEVNMSYNTISNIGDGNIINQGTGAQQVSLMFLDDLAVEHVHRKTVIRKARFRRVWTGIASCIFGAAAGVAAYAWLKTTGRLESTDAFLDLVIHPQLQGILQLVTALISLSSEVLGIGNICLKSEDEKRNEEVLQVIDERRRDLCVSNRQWKRAKKQAQQAANERTC